MLFDRATGRCRSPSLYSWSKISSTRFCSSVLHKYMDTFMTVDVCIAVSQLRCKSPREQLDQFPVLHLRYAKVVINKLICLILDEIRHWVAATPPKSLELVPNPTPEHRSASWLQRGRQELTCRFTQCSTLSTLNGVTPPRRDT